MKEIATFTVSLIKDRNVLKWRVNFVKNGKVFGWLKPI